MTLRLTIALSGSFLIFDVGILGNAFELISGALPWKIVLTFGVALAPLSTAIGIALWLSAAEHGIRQGRGAGAAALVAGLTAIIGLVLIVPFRAAAGGEDLINPYAFTFLAFLQVALGMAETMLYTIYFDARVGIAMRKEIAQMATRAPELERQADREIQRREKAGEAIGQIKTEAAVQADELEHDRKVVEEMPIGEEGQAETLRGIVEASILEGEAGRLRPDLAPGSSDLARANSLAYASLATAAFAIIVTGIHFL